MLWHIGAKAGEDDRQRQQQKRKIQVYFAEDLPAAGSAAYVLSRRVPPHDPVSADGGVPPVQKPDQIPGQGQAGAEESAELPSERLRSIILCVAAAGVFKNHTLKGVFSGLLQRIQPSGIHIRKTLMPVVRRMDIIAE